MVARHGLAHSISQHWTQHPPKRPLQLMTPEKVLMMSSKGVGFNILLHYSFLKVVQSYKYEDGLYKLLYMLFTKLSITIETALVT